MSTELWQPLTAKEIFAAANADPGRFQIKTEAGVYSLTVKPGKDKRVGEVTQVNAPKR